MPPSGRPGTACPSCTSFATDPSGAGRADQILTPVFLSPWLGTRSRHQATLPRHPALCKTILVFKLSSHVVLYVRATQERRALKTRYLTKTLLLSTQLFSADQLNILLCFGSFCSRSCRYADPAASRTGPKQQETGATWLDENDSVGWRLLHMLIFVHTLTREREREGETESLSGLVLDAGSKMQHPFNVARPQ